MAVRHLVRGSRVALVFIPVLLCSRVTVGAVPTGNVGTISLAWTFDPASLDFETEREYTRVSLRNGYCPEVEPGRPCLPALSAYVLLPSGASVSDIRVEADEFLQLKDVLVYPTQPMRTTNDPPGPFTPPDPAAYSSMEKMPTDIACVLGIHRWLGRTLAALRLNPVRYIAGQGALYFASRIEVELTYKGPAGTIRAAGHRSSRGRSAVMDLVANPEDMDRFEPMDEEGPTHGLHARPADIQAAADDTAVYLLITSEALAPAFQPLVDRRTAQGKPGKLVTTEWISAHYAGTRPAGGPDEQTKIRNCIIDHYANHGTTWVCLAGDDTIIPLRYVPIDNPTDMYYACLNGTYDEDNDGVYGEASEDDADLLPEVWIGRIPVRTRDQASAYINKLIEYETAPPSGFANTMLIGSSFDWYMSGLGRPAGFWDHDPVDEGEWPMRTVYRNFVQPYWQATPLGELFNSFSTWDQQRCGDYKVTYEHMVESLNRGFHHVYVFGHGNPGGGAGLDGSMADRLTNASRPSIFFVTSCSTAAIDAAEPSQSEAMIRCPHGGGVAYIGASRSEWNSTFTAEVFYTEVFANKRETLGEAFARSKMAFVSWSEEDGVHRGNQWILNLHGDPALLFPPESRGRALQMLSPKGCEVIDARSDITIRWNASGTGFHAGEMVELHYSADGGRSWLPVPGLRRCPFNGRLFVWRSPGLPTGSQYRMRIVSVSDPTVSDASTRNFSIAPLKLLTVRSTPNPPGFWISGTHANQTDYTFTMLPGEPVALTATLQPWQNSSRISGYNFSSWTDALGRVLTGSVTLGFTASDDRVVVAQYQQTGAPRDYYVNDETPENGFQPGDNDHNGMSPTTPARRIQQITGRYTDIGTIHVSAGTYAENIVLSEGNSNLVIEGSDGDHVIIDGNQKGPCLTVIGGRDITIRNVLFRNGKAVEGGAIACSNSSLTFENCRICDSTALTKGGALCGFASIVAFNGCIITNNTAMFGGAVCITGMPDETSECTFDGSAITMNSAPAFGGALYLNEAAVRIRGCTISHNITEGSGGAMCVTFAHEQMELAMNTFENNTAGQNGGAIDSRKNTLVILTGNQFLGNHSGGPGGAIDFWNSTATIRDNFFCMNAGTLGGGISVRSQSQATLNHNTIVGNIGDGVYCENSSPTISHCILWGNSPAQVYLVAASPTVTFCDVQGGWPSSRANAGNIADNPLFVDPDGPDNDLSTWQDNDYHIQAQSPCRDAGDPAFVPAEGETDIDDQPRVINGRVDIGADEYHG